MFKVGDKVECVDATGMEEYLDVGKIYKVVRVRGNGIVVNIGFDREEWCFNERFEAVAEPVVLPFVVGATVECLYDGYHYVKIGIQYPIQNVKLDRLGAVSAIRVKGALYTKLYRFKVVAVAAPAAPVKEWNRDKWVPKVGEQVYITGDDPGFADEMRELINNGEVYTISYVGAQIHLEGHMWVYRLPGEALTPVAASGAIIKPPTPKPRPVHKHEDLRDDLISKGCGGLCSFAFEYDNGNRYYEKQGACHARLDSWGDRGGNKNRVKLVYNLPHQIANVKSCRASSFKSRNTVEEHNQCADYIINRSPWSIAFLTKDMEEACTKGLFMDVEQNVNVIAASCCALRSCYEQFDRSPMFCMLVKNGVDEHAAFLTACAITETNDSYSFNGWGGAHDVLDCNRDFNDILKFFKSGFHTGKGIVADPFRTHHERYVMAGACAEFNDKESVGKWFKDNTKAIETGEGFYKNKTITKESVINVANLLSQLIKDYV